MEWVLPLSKYTIEKVQRVTGFTLIAQVDTEKGERIGGSENNRGERQM